MINFNDWVAEKGQLNEFQMAQNVMNQPMTGAMQRGLGVMNKATHGMSDNSVGQKRMMSSILQQVRQLDPVAQKKVARMIMDMSKHPMEDQAVNPKARYDGGN